MSGGQFVIDPTTGERKRVGDVHKTPTRAERRAATHAAEAEAAEVAASSKAEPGDRKGRRRKPVDTASVPATNTNAADAAQAKE